MSDSVPSEYPILATSQEHCSVCDDSPPINFEDWRAEDKLPLTVYGRDGSYQVSCHLQNRFFWKKSEGEGGLF